MLNQAGKQTTKPVAKKRPNKQHAVKGSSWMAFSDAIEEGWSPDMTAHVLCQLIVQAARNEGRRVRKLR